MFLLAFFALFRIGEITQTSNANHTLLNSDVCIYHKNGHTPELEVTLRHSKHNTSATMLQVHPHKHRRLCPVTAIQLYCRVRPSVNGQFFVNNKGHPVTDKHFRKVFKKCISKLNLNPSAYTPHSFRIGGATSAHLHNLSDSKIRHLGRWKSNAFLKYIRPSKISCL